MSSVEVGLCCQATPREVLMGELMDSNVPKSEREHAAVREIARLTAELEKCREALRPFIYATLTLDGKVIGLMREDFERASNAIDAARSKP